MQNTQRIDPERKLRRQLRQKVEWGRWGMLAIIAVTFLNQILLLCGVKYHFLFSAAMPYYMNWMAIQMDLTGFKVVATLLTILLYLAYAACWLLSGHQKEWMLAALGLYSVDTVLLFVFAVTLLENPASCLLEILTHGLGIALLVYALLAFERLSKMPRPRRRSVEQKNDVSLG